jgi:hypothetical protein
MADFLECGDVCHKFPFNWFCFPPSSKDILLLHKHDTEFTVSLSLSLSQFKHLHFPLQNKSRGVSSPSSKFTRFCYNKHSWKFGPDLSNVRRGSVCSRRQTLVGIPRELFIRSKTTPGDHSLLVGRHCSYLPWFSTEESTRLHCGGTVDIAVRSSRSLRKVVKFLPAYTVSHLRPLFCLRQS